MNYHVYITFFFAACLVLVVVHESLLSPLLRNIVLFLSLTPDSQVTLSINSTVSAQSSLPPN